MSEHRIEVWGIAAGRRSTEGAAPGAFTWRQYPVGKPVPENDWRTIVSRFEVEVEAAQREARP